MNHFLKIIMLSMLFLSISCSKDTAETSPSPVAALLTSPLKDTECNTGTLVSTTENKVDFQWKASNHTDKYTVVVTNLNTKVVTEKEVSTPAATFTLIRGVPYSWKVISKSNNTTVTASSETWKFYNAGEGISNYAPFPADVVSPLMGSTVSSNPVTLQWNTTDIDNDISKYEVYFGTTNPPTLLHTTTTNKSITNLNVTPKTIYYWKVITIDAKNNRSTSPIFDFKTQ
ncbi:hypothetical protein SLW70_14190 [Flavobacterium sp. NG2]|uniref:hypothetical protein n=1 Tax=Flavobacterium sp. NG2 TaxID=3097547 RepID=UPI002A8151F5|nr:hypothetical protein [Flavobacterium sp. NG2]WPR71074.1 hypothetical protein SLW70_14190 [Flavobacterium sp. NG2]